ncbi:LOW QUALITY PROTEIN: scavenger receptor cysteine-rich type 1 protein M130-like, partial [Gymnodraco acuticeps]|uniref:LOW QUALITY PROTEIN: scavenger receptor cysteine-rich type 1 protein M130-like n=1 Tax=Gymnodraco acuticeps TaxID=8218 RepID=A0A6P8VQR7_GYMAC
MDHLLLLVMLLVCSSGLQAEGELNSTGLQAEGELNSTEPGVRLVGGESRCAGALELEHQGEWRPVEGYPPWTLKAAGVACRELDCGSAVSVGRREESSKRDVWWIRPNCAESGSALRECAASSYSEHILNLTCSDSVRLLGGTALCSGRLEVNSDPSDPSWSSVCEADFDQQDAQVVCRQLGCGAPSVLQGALYGEGEAPMGTKEFQCGGHESALLDCSSASERSTCSPGTAVSLTCSEPGGVQLVGGESRCAGALELEHQGEWRPVDFHSLWTLKAAGVVCRELDCGSAVSVGEREESSERDVWWISSNCAESGSALWECAASLSSNFFLNLTCSDSVRLLGGTALCSGRLEVNSDPSDPSWSSVCEADFDQQDAQVVCRQLGCGAPSVLQGALYGEGEAPMGTKEFQCGGHESALLDCSSASERNTCSPGTAVSLTCSEPGGVQLVGGESRCAGALELEHQGEWRPVGAIPWTLKAAGVACRELDCGSAVSVRRREESSERDVWRIRSLCVESGSALRECAASYSSNSFLNLTCS